MRRSLLLVFALVACDCHAADRAEREPSPPARTSLASIAFAAGDTMEVQDVRRRLAPVVVHDPYEDREVTFLAVPAADVLDERFGPTWREADEVVFACDDGYRAGVPVRLLLSGRAYLAFGREGGEFAIDKPEGGEIRRVPLSPAYLVWERTNEGERHGEDEREWPYQIVGVELASVAERYARLTPLEPTTEEVARGFEAFRRYCVRCHAINGQGGRVGPELNVPASVTEYMREEWLLRFILEPTSVRYRTSMPGLPTHVEEREARARDLVAYLEAMAQRKLVPGSD